jgi:hypothetical protein
LTDLLSIAITFGLLSSFPSLFFFFLYSFTLKYDRQDRQGKAASNERSPHPTQQQAPAARSPGGTQRKTGQGISPLENNRMLFFYSARYCLITPGNREEDILSKIK